MNVTYEKYIELFQKFLLSLTPNYNMSTTYIYIHIWFWYVYGKIYIYDSGMYTFLTIYIHGPSGR